MTLRMYDLVGEREDCRISPFCWRVKLAAAHKGLELETIPWRPTQKDRIAFSGQGLVPVLLDGETVVYDSWTILNYLEDAYPDRPALFPHPTVRNDALFLKFWTETALAPVMMPLVILDIFRHFHPEDRPYFRTTREQRFGKTLEEANDPSPARMDLTHKTLEPLRQVLKQTAFLGGDAPNVSDYLLIGPFATMRSVSTLAPVAPGDPIYDWKERMFDRFNGLIRKSFGYDT